MPCFFKGGPSWLLFFDTFGAVQNEFRLDLVDLEEINCLKKTTPVVNEPHLAARGVD